MNAKTCKKMRKLAKQLSGDESSANGTAWKMLYKKWKKEVKNVTNP